jgi:uncharacterized protein
VKSLPTGVRLSATDLSNHLACPHLTTLDRGVALGRITATTYWDPRAAALRARGEAHEQAYLDALRTGGKMVFEIDQRLDPAAAAVESRAAMARGDEIIAQATLLDDAWLGRADLLLRVEQPSRLGTWSYEVADTKLAVETRGATVLQLCLYSDLLARVQDRWPEHMHVVAPGEPFVIDQLRTDNFVAYYRLVKRRLEATIAAPFDDAATYPLPTAHCDVCRWWAECDQRWRRDDHLSLVAGMHRAYERELSGRRISTLAALAAEPLPLTWRPDRGAVATYAKLREQARVQHVSRGLVRPVHELLAREPERGFARLPPPSPGDLFLDLEGDPFVDGGGREYLTGLVVIDADGNPEYRAVWGLDPAAEKVAFEWLVDLIVERRAAHPELHVYHFHSYEPAALKRLMGRHGTREDEVDTILRAGLFVDLHSIVRQALRAGVENYSIKSLEALYGFERALRLRDASVSLRAVELALEIGEPSDVGAGVREQVEVYNCDDCLSALHLRDWLECERASLVAAGEEIPRPVTRDGGPSEDLSERRRRVEALTNRLLEGVPVDSAERSEEQYARWLLAHLLDWHRREEKVAWWEFFRLAETDDEERLEEPCALAGLEFLARIGGTHKCPIDRYRYPAQEMQIRADDTLHVDADRKLGSVESVNLASRTIDVKKRGDARDLHPRSFFAHSVVKAEPQEQALLRLGEWAIENGIDAAGPLRSARDLLLRRPPRLRDRVGGALQQLGEDTLAAARRLALTLDGGVLPVQGPPGAGKTFTAARVIIALVAAGKRVGITALSHKVIRNLLDEVVRAARKEGVRLRCIQKTDRESELPDPLIEETDQNAPVRDALASGAAQVAAGTGWLWARADMHGAVDVLVVDEAGQMSLADAAAVAQAAESLILIGDPCQLEQPLQGTHPDGCELSALEHLLGDHRTIPPDRGLFLEETWRLHPDVCVFTSEQFYEGRLRSRAGLDRQQLRAAAPFDRSGLFHFPVRHEGNQNSSAEEAEAIAALVRKWLISGASWVDSEGREAALTLNDILIVTPYNAQIAVMAECLPSARIGTVDKFQGQQAPVVIYSMATSSPEDAPRGMEFLYSRNRLNVATSRAQCAVVLVASPRLFEPECRTPGQMRLANALCRYLELAQTVASP